MSMTRIDQGMAVAAAKALPANLKVDRELRTRYRQLRAMLRSAGLAATYAYIVSKAGDGSELAKAYAAAEKAIRERIFADTLQPGNARAVLSRLGEMNAVDYARASAQASAFAGWLSRLADAAYQEAGEGNARGQGNARGAHNAGDGGD